MVTMTVVTSLMKTIVPLQVLLVKVQRNCVMMVACVSIPAGFVTVKLIVMMVRMRKAATVSTCCLFIVVVCWSSIMINHWSKSLHIVITNIIMENFEFLHVTGKNIISCWQINRVKTCVSLRFWTLGGKLGLTPRQRVGKALWVLPRSGGVLCWKILKFYICRDVFLILKFQTISFNCQKKIAFLDNLIMVWYLH